MKTKLFLLSLAAASVLCGCKDEWTEQRSLMVQLPYEGTEQYYENLRAYKNTPHQVFYGWFASYANREGLENEAAKTPASMGERFAGLPDSLDFCSCWGGVPTPEKNPLAYKEMREARDRRGIKMLVVTICRIQQRKDADGNLKWPNPASLSAEEQEQAMKDYAAELVAEVMVTDENGVSYIDGLDLDYEPDGDWLSGARFTTFVQEVGRHIGPMAETELGRSKYLMIDFYSTTPQAGTEPYVNYFVRQAYTQGFSEHSDERLQSGYDGIASWCPSHKYIITEKIDELWATGGSPFLFNGVAAMRADNTRMHSLEGFARWNPTQGPKGGIGGYWFERDYQNFPPYRYTNEAIRIMNPPVL